MSIYPDSSAGVNHICKECTKTKRKLYVIDNKDKCKISDRRYHLSKYGLTLSDYNEIFTEQNGKCLGCNKHQSELKRALVVDHCHKTNKIRGLLCWQCNSALGMLLDNKNTLLNLVTYLTNSETADNNSVVENEDSLGK